MRILQALASEGGPTALSSTSASSRISRGRHVGPQPAAGVPQPILERDWPEAAVSGDHTPRWPFVIRDWSDWDQPHTRPAPVSESSFVALRPTQIHPRLTSSPSDSLRHATPRFERRLWPIHLTGVALVGRSPAGLRVSRVRTVAREVAGAWVMVGSCAKGVAGVPSDCRDVAVAPDRWIGVCGLSI